MRGCLFLLGMILISKVAFSQKCDEDIRVIEAIESYKDCNALCFERPLIDSDWDTYLITKDCVTTKKQFKELFSGLSPSMPDLSRYYSRIKEISHDTIWNKALLEWADSIEDRNAGCLGYKLSIGRPINLSSENDKLVIITAYKHDSSEGQYDAFVYLYNVRRINDKWTVCGSDNIYEIMDEWRNTSEH